MYTEDNNEKLPGPVWLGLFHTYTDNREFMAYFWLDGKIMNSPSDKHERPVANALVIFRRETKGKNESTIVNQKVCPSLVCEIQRKRIAELTCPLLHHGQN